MGEGVGVIVLVLTLCVGTRVCFAFKRMELPESVRKAEQTRATTMPLGSSPEPLLFQPRQSQVATFRAILQ